MDWFTQLGNMASLFPGTPALAWDMALNGPEPNHWGYEMAYDLQTSPVELDPYPAEPGF